MSVSLSTSHRSSYLLILFRHLQYNISVLNYLEFYTQVFEGIACTYFIFKYHLQWFKIFPRYFGNCNPSFAELKAQKLDFI